MPYPTTALREYVLRTELPALIASLVGGSGGSGVLTTDARLSDARTPTGTALGDLVGTYPAPVLAAGVATGVVLGTDVLTTGAAQTKAGQLILSAGLALGQSATSPVLTTGGTIATSGIGVSLVSPAAPVTGIIMQSGTATNPLMLVVNQGAVTSTITMAGVGTSNVGNGSACVIAGGLAQMFVWVQGTGIWYPIAGAATGQSLQPITGSGLLTLSKVAIAGQASSFAVSGSFYDSAMYDTGIYGTPPSNYGTVTVLANFESGSVSNEWFITHEGSTWGNSSITPVQTFVRNGAWSARLHVDTASVAPAHSGERCELSSNSGNFEPAGDWFYSFSTYYPSGTENSAGFSIQTFFNVIQWIDERAVTSPPLSISITKWPNGLSTDPPHFVFNRFLINQNTLASIEAYDTWDLGAVVTNQWDDWTVHIKQSTVPSGAGSGSIEVWRNGTLWHSQIGTVRTLDDKIGGTTDPRVYIEAQVYRNYPVTGQNTMYFDYLRRHTQFT